MITYLFWSESSKRMGNQKGTENFRDEKLDMNMTFL